MQYGNRLIRHLVGLIFIGIFLLSGSPSEAKINVGGWKNFGANINDFSLNDYTAFNALGESYDLRKDIDYLGYRGENILDDITINGKKINTGIAYTMNSKSDTLIIKKIGIHNGKFLEVRVTPEVTPMTMKINADNVNELLEVFTKDLNSSATRFDVKMSFFYEGTEIQPVIETGRNFLLPVKHINGWPEYNFAMLIEKDSKLLIGNKSRDSIARTKSKTYLDSSKYRIAVGGATENGSKYYYSLLFNRPIFYIGRYTVGNFVGNTTRLFDPIDAPSSIPKPYNDITFQSKSTEYSNITNSSAIYSEIDYSLPKQDSTTFYPESIDLDIHTKNIDEYDDYDLKYSCFSMGEPTLTVNNIKIKSDEYSYNPSTHRLTLPKNFVIKYAGKTIKIRTDNVVLAGNRLESGLGMKKYYLGNYKFKIPTSLEVTSNYDTFTRKEFTDELSAVLEMRIKYTLTQNNKEVELGTNSIDYSEYYFISNIVSGYVFDHLQIRILEKEFNTLTNEETVSISIYSDYFNETIVVDLPIKVYENIPIVYKLEDGTLITSDNKDILHEVKRYSETPVKFKIPVIFDNYSFVSSINKELQFGETVDNFKEATGLLNTTTKKIELVYKMNKIGVIVEYLLDSETGKYEKHQPIKVGTALSQDKPNIKFETEIGQKITDFIKNNKDQVNPEVPYYHNHQETGKTANYWRYSDEPVSDKNPLRPVDSEDKIPSRPITITSFYSGTASLNSVDDMDFGTHKNNLKVNEITSKKAINYSFVDTTFNKQTSLNVRFDVPMKNEKNQKMTAFMLDYKGKSINQQDVPVIKSKDTEKNIFTGDLKSDLLFKRYWLGPENFGQFSGVLVWTISRDITP